MPRLGFYGFLSCKDHSGAMRIARAHLDLIFSMVLEELTKSSQSKTCGIWIVLRMDKRRVHNNLHENASHWMTG